MIKMYAIGTSLKAYLRGQNTSNRSQSVRKKKKLAKNSVFRILCYSTYMIEKPYKLGVFSLTQGYFNDGAEIKLLSEGIMVNGVLYAYSAIKDARRKLFGWYQDTIEIMLANGESIFLTTSNRELVTQTATSNWMLITGAGHYRKLKYTGKQWPLFKHDQEGFKELGNQLRQHGFDVPGQGVISLRVVRDNLKLIAIVLASLATAALLSVLILPPVYAAVASMLFIIGTMHYYTFVNYKRYYCKLRDIVIQSNSQGRSSSAV